MLSIAFIHDLISGHRTDAPRMFSWTGETLKDLAPDNASFAFVGREKVERENFADVIPPDGSQVVFVQVPELIVPWYLYYFKPLVIDNLMDFLFPKIPQLPPEGEIASRGFGNVQNATAEGSTIPVIYGENLAGGVALQRWTEEGPTKDEVFHAQYLLSHGPVYSVAGLTADTTDPVESTSLAKGDLYINGIDATELSDCKIQVRLGSDPNGIMRGFENVVTQYDANTEVTHEDFFTWETRDAVNAVEANIYWPEGLYYLAKDDGRVNRRVAHLWMGVWAEGDDPDVDTAVTSQEFLVFEKRRKPFTTSIRIGNLETDHYVVRVWYPTRPTHIKIPDRYFGKTMVAAIKEIQCVRGGGIDYTNMALLGLEVRATDQLSGGAPTVSVRVKGRTVYNAKTATTEWSQNPAWCCRDLVLNTTYGLGDSIVAGGIDAPSFETWADWCDALIAKWTGSAATEARYKLNAVLNDASDAWPAVQRLAAEHGAYLVNMGTSIRVKISQQQDPVFLFTSANIRASERNTPVLSLSVDSPDTRVDAVTVQFRDEALDFEDGFVTVPLGIVTTESTQVKTVTLQSVTSKTQANRMAHRFFREEKANLETWSWEAGIDSMPVEVGDMVYVGREQPSSGYVWHGRISAYDGSSITLDQSVLFEANTAYTYIEQDNDTNTINRRDFEMSAGAATVLPFAPLAAGVATFRKWIIGKRVVVEEPVLIRRIVSAEGGFRRIEGVNYAEEVYTDEADSIDPAVYSPALGTAPTAPTNLAVSEAWYADGISTLTVTWTGGADTSKYHVWIRELMEDSVTWSHCGVVPDGTDPHSFAFRSDAETGTPVEIAIQAIGLNGQETAVNAATVTHIIARDDDNDTVSIYPDTVTGMTLTQTSGNEYSLTWDAVSPVTSYEVRSGNTQGGLLLGSPATESLTLYGNRAANYVDVRAILNGKYSQGVARIVFGPPTHTGEYGAYTTLEGYIEMEPIAGADVRTGTAVGVGYVRNASRIQWLNGDNAMIQTIKTDAEPMAYITQGVDLGSSKTVHVSPAVRVLSWFDDIIGDHALSEGDWSWSGRIGAQYLDWTLYVQYGETVGYEKTFVAGLVASGVTVTENLNQNTTLTGRYFRLYLACTPRRMPDTNLQECRALLEKLALYLYS